MASPLVRLTAPLVFIALGAFAAPPAASEESARSSAAKRTKKLEAAFVKMLSGRTLEGTFTITTKPAADSALAKEKYTIGDVKKVAENIWMIPARIEYGDKDVTLPVVVPVRWAGDTPVVVVDNQDLPGFGAVTARVMFFDDHYAGYWKHGDYGGHLFGIIRPSQEGSRDKSVEETKADSR